MLHLHWSPSLTLALALLFILSFAFAGPRPPALGQSGQVLLTIRLRIFSPELQLHAFALQVTSIENSPALCFLQSIPVTQKVVGLSYTPQTDPC